MSSKSYIWTEDEIDKLTKSYSDAPWQNLAKVLPTKPRHIIRKKACAMKLRKSRVGRGHYGVDENFFKNWSPEMAYVTGVIAADGEIYVNEFHNKYDLEITSKDFAWLDEIRKILKAEHPIYGRTYRMKNGGQSEVYRFRVGSAKLVKDLLKVGIPPKKSLVLRFPCLPHQYLNHFVRGYFDGDGSIYAYKSVQN